MVSCYSLSMNHYSLSHSDPTRFLSVILGMQWIDDSPLRLFKRATCFSLHQHREPIFAHQMGYSPSVEAIKTKKKKYA